MTRRSREEFRLKRVYEPAAPEDGTRFLVDRLWPRGIRKQAANVDAWLRDVAPSTELCKWFGHDPAKWAEFKRRYRHELEHNPEPWHAILDTAREEPVTLIYSARDEQHNNALVLKEFLDNKLAGK